MGKKEQGPPARGAIFTHVPVGVLFALGADKGGRKNHQAAGKALRDTGGTRLETPAEENHAPHTPGGRSRQHGLFTANHPRPAESNGECGEKQGGGEGGERKDHRKE
ncbi:hypothetical protein ZHAS_00018566 [Anopheles sinensis]|uniref:Uncharacterized protein n=1 Tax=Anopheles sinensis TaxID=74873 RepID=A0A084WJY1_ANOSI|nr:hypothetical protein ZHAS_00018566 [Anopheles sinensis]